MFSIERYYNYEIVYKITLIHRLENWRIMIEISKLRDGVNFIRELWKLPVKWEKYDNWYLADINFFDKITEIAGNSWGFLKKLRKLREKL